MWVDKVNEGVEKFLIWRLLSEVVGLCVRVDEEGVMIEDVLKMGEKGFLVC